MSAVREPGTSSQHIESGRGEKRLKPELLAANVARLPHVTGTHGLRNRALDTRSFGVEFLKLRRFLTEASQIESVVTRFIWSQDQDFCCHRGTLCMKRTRAAESKGETNAQARLAVPVGNMPPISAEVSGRTDRLVHLPIDLKLAMIKTSSFFGGPGRIRHSWPHNVHLIAALALCVTYGGQVSSPAAEKPAPTYDRSELEAPLPSAGFAVSVTGSFPLSLYEVPRR
jgi:hypothetical protein